MLHISAVVFLYTASFAAATKPDVGFVTLGSDWSSCETVGSYSQELGAGPSILSEGLVSERPRICEQILATDKRCCTAEMEELFSLRVRKEHEKAIKVTLQILQNILHTRGVRFHGYFIEMLKTSKESFHEMFKKTYGFMYEQNAHIFIDLFQALEEYYMTGLGDLDHVVGTFFETLYKKMFIVLNSQYNFDDLYLECIVHHMSAMQPFGDVPQKLSIQIKRALVATRSFHQALQIASEVLKNMQRINASEDCSLALARMITCPPCRGIHNQILACNDFCEHVMRNCLVQYTSLDSDWNNFIEVLDKVGDRLLGPFNIEVLFKPINLKISEAIMNFQESSSDISQRVFVGCGRPALGRRRKQTKMYHHKRNEKKADENLEEKQLESKELRSNSMVLDELVREIKQRIRDSRQFWLSLPYKFCNNGLVNPFGDDKDCWNGSHIDEYRHHGSLQEKTRHSNSRLQAVIPRIKLVKEQIYALNSISAKLRSAFNGQHVDWIDTDEPQSSGKGSGDLNQDSSNDDEDGFVDRVSDLHRLETPTDRMTPPDTATQHGGITISSPLPSVTRDNIIRMRSELELDSEGDDKRDHVNDTRMVSSLGIASCHGVTISILTPSVYMLSSFYTSF